MTENRIQLCQILSAQYSQDRTFKHMAVANCVREIPLLAFLRGYFNEPATLRPLNN